MILSLRRTCITLLLRVMVLMVLGALAYSQTLTVLHTFNGSDGESPNGSFLRDAAGNLYGTTSFGAAGFGTIFKLDPAGNYTVLYSFLGSPNDGSGPESLLWDKKGHLYGTTFQGGTNDSGTVFRFSANGKETVIHSFDPATSDGDAPSGGLVQDAAGNLYGTTSFGGRYNGGIAFQIGSTGNEKILFNFRREWGRWDVPRRSPADR